MGTTSNAPITMGFHPGHLPMDMEHNMVTTTESTIGVTTVEIPTIEIPTVEITTVATEEAFTLVVSL